MTAIMSLQRELKRVPLEFDWPLHKVWDGYLNPYYKECPKCENGFSKVAERINKGLNNIVYGVGEEITKEEIKLLNFLCDTDYETGGSFNWCGSAHYKALLKIGEWVGFKEGWHTCEHCGGDATDPVYKVRYEDWEEEEPPTGEGFQLWESVSEGSPCSPVFKTVEELCRWLANNYTVCRNYYTKDQWMEILEGEKFGFEIHTGKLKCTE